MGSLVVKEERICFYCAIAGSLCGWWCWSTRLDIAGKHNNESYRGHAVVTKREAEVPSEDLGCSLQSRPLKTMADSATWLSLRGPWPSNFLLSYCPTFLAMLASPVIRVGCWSKSLGNCFERLGKLVVQHATFFSVRGICEQRIFFSVLGTTSVWEGMM